MGKWKKAVALLSVSTLLMTMVSGCGTKKEYDLYIFSTKGETAEALKTVATAYEEETGVKVKTFSLGSGTDSSETLRAEMNSNNKPSIFCVMNSQELIEWQEGGFARELTESKTDEFKTLVEDIPEEFRLSSNGTDSYGVPFNVEGYGYIVNTTLLGELFGDGDEVADALKEATYDEWEAFVLAMDQYVDSDKSTTVTLDGESFTLAANKTEEAKKLEGIFAVAGSEKWTYGDHMINVALNAVFDSPLQASQATVSEVESLKGALVAYAKALDLKTNHATVARGSELINSTTHGYDASVEEFASGKTLFLKQGNWVYGNFEKTTNPNIVENLEFIPVKLPLTDADIKAEGQTVEHINSSISVYVPNYYVINAKVSEEEQRLAEDFLVWLNTTEKGQKFVTEDMAFIPYNANPETTAIDNSLGASIVDYMKDGDVISNPYAGAPSGWSGDVVGLSIMENYLTKEHWEQEDYDKIADYAIEKWISMGNLK